jgi:hypothetical protein
MEVITTGSMPIEDPAKIAEGLVGHHGPGDLIENPDNVAAADFGNGAIAEGGQDQALKRSHTIGPSAKGRAFTREPFIDHSAQGVGLAEGMASFKVGAEGLGASAGGGKGGGRVRAKGHSTAG